MHCSVPTGFRLACLLAAVVAAACDAPVPADSDRSTSGRIVKVIDGDSLLARTVDGSEVELRMWGIDAPEHRQPWSDQSRDMLKKLALQRQVTLKLVDTDRYGRRVVRMTRDDGMDIGDEMIRTGNAWVYRRYNDDKTMAALEHDAQSDRRGLWALPQKDRLPPWEWRGQARR